MSTRPRITSVSSRKELRQFIFLPAILHKDHRLWVPPIYHDEWKYFDLTKNKYTTYCDAALFLAKQNGESVGRIMAIINHRYNELRREKTGRFAYLECRNDQDAAHLLLTHAEQWVNQRGMNKIVGPLGFCDQDPEGFLVEGFYYPPTLSTYQNFPYMIDLLQNEGYRKDVDYVVYKVDIRKPIPPFYYDIYRRVTRQADFRLMEFESRRQLRSYIKPIFLLVNQCFSGLYGFCPLEAGEIDDLARKFLPIVDPRFVKVVIRNKAVVGFVVGIPNMSDGIRRSKGRLFPFGVFHILRSARRTKQLDLMIGAINNECRGRGLDVLIGVNMIDSARKAGFEFLDSHLELESNTMVRAEMEKLEGQLYKRYRIFQKSL